MYTLKKAYNIIKFGVWKQLFLTFFNENYKDTYIADFLQHIGKHFQFECVVILGINYAID